MGLSIWHSLSLSKLKRTGHTSHTEWSWVHVSYSKAVESSGLWCHGRFMSTPSIQNLVQLVFCSIWFSWDLLVGSTKQLSSSSSTFRVCRHMRKAHLHPSPTRRNPVLCVGVRGTGPVQTWDPFLSWLYPKNPWRRILMTFYYYDCAHRWDMRTLSWTSIYLISNHQTLHALVIIPSFLWFLDLIIFFLKNS